MRAQWFKCFLIIVATVIFNPVRASAPMSTGTTSLSDPRLTRLQTFFERYECPVSHLAPDFIEASDENDIDWRLLPSIAFVESTCGKAYKRNNIFGWGNGTIPFRSIATGIRTVAERLANSVYYRGKSINHVLATYNPVPGYATRVRAVMRELGPAPPKSSQTAVR